MLQWLVASFLTWHSLHGKPAHHNSSSGNLALQRYHVTTVVSIHDKIRLCKYFMKFSEKNFPRNLRTSPLFFVHFDDTVFYLFRIVFLRNTSAIHSKHTYHFDCICEVFYSNKIIENIPIKNIRRDIISAPPFCLSSYIFLSTFF